MRKRSSSGTQKRHPNPERLLTLRGEATEVFITALMNPPPPNEAFLAAAERYRKLCGNPQEKHRQLDERLKRTNNS